MAAIAFPVAVKTKAISYFTLIPFDDKAPILNQPTTFVIELGFTFLILQLTLAGGVANKPTLVVC